MKVKLALWILSVLLFGIAGPASAPPARANDPAGSSDCVDDTWAATSMDSAPSPREGHTAVWTGSEMIVWGGGPFITNTGGRYDPATDTWAPTSLDGAPSPRTYHTAVWTGREMIVWGGIGPGFTRLDTGGRYNPATDTWTATGTDGVPSARFNHTAVWTGQEMIVWGGRHDIIRLNTGGRYDPVTDTWAATNTDGAPSGRENHTAVWTGTEMIVWGGYSGGNTGGRYDPVIGTWVATNTDGAPSARFRHTAVWTGKEMVIWGGEYPYTNTGGHYDPVTDTWVAINLIDAPSARREHTAVWTGTEMLVWGGYGGSFPYILHTGGRYDPATYSWAATRTDGAPRARYWHTAVWTGTEMIVWGGTICERLCNETDTGGRYCASAGKEAVAASSAGERVGSARGKALIISLLIAPSMIEFSDLVRVNIDGYG